MECSSNRTISLVSHCSKIMLRVIAGRMKNKSDEEIADEQYSFRTSKGIRNQIFNLKLIMEKHRAVPQPIHVFHRLPKGI